MLFKAREWVGPTRHWVQAASGIYLRPTNLKYNCLVIIVWLRYDLRWGEIVVSVKKRKLTLFVNGLDTNSNFWLEGWTYRTFLYTLPPVLALNDGFGHESYSALLSSMIVIPYS